MFTAFERRCKRQRQRQQQRQQPRQWQPQRDARDRSKTIVKRQNEGGDPKIRSLFLSRHFKLVVAIVFGL